MLGNKRDLRSSARGVGLVGYAVLAIVIIIALIVLVALFGVVMLILAGAVIGGFLLAAFGGAMPIRISGVVIAIIAILIAAFVYLSTAGGLGI
jgi:hypothetical protein